MIMVSLIIGFGLFFIRPAENSGEYRIIMVQEGMSLRETADRLEENEIITNKTLFMLWARLMGYSRKIKAGEYRLSSSMAPIRIMEVLTRGIIITHPVTIPEGFSIKQIASLLEEKKLADAQEFLSVVYDEVIIKRYGISSPSLEGYLYPDTYQFGKGLSANSIVDAMIKRFKAVIEPLKARIDESGMSMEEVLTLASIVEKETGNADERPLIASVFLNRLKKGMRLESDPTVIYGINNFSGNIKKKHLSEHTIYNTYVFKGLPAGPIANPGLESIRAVLFPAETDFLYFVSKNDGTHHFSKTLREHNRAVLMYQKRRRH